MWIYLIIGLMFIAIGLAVHVLKWHFLISGYNTMSREKKANVDTEGLGRLMGIYSYLNGVVYIIAGILHRLGIELAIIPAIIITMISTVFLLIKAQKYDGNIKGRKSKKNTFSILITILSLIFVVVLMYRSVQPTKVTFLEEGLEIHGMYGDVYSWDSIEEIDLLDELPTIKMRTNGSAVGSYLKGNFSTEEMGSVRLHVNTQASPFIYIETNKRTVIFNMSDSDDTLRILEEILLRIE